MTATAPPETRPQTPPNRAVSITKLGYGAITAVIALVAAASGQVLQFFPGLRADPRDRSGADLAVFAVDSGVTYGDWVSRTASSAKDRREREDEFVRASAGTLDVPEADRAVYLGRLGAVAYVRVTVEGFKRNKVIVRWSMYDNTTKRRIPHISSANAGLISIAAPTDRSVIRLWAPEATGHKKVFLRIGLFAREGATMLAVTDSPAFPGETPDQALGP